MNDFTAHDCMCYPINSEYDAYIIFSEVLTHLSTRKWKKAKEIIDGVTVNYSTLHPLRRALEPQAWGVGWKRLVREALADDFPVVLIIFRQKY